MATIFKDYGSGGAGLISKAGTGGSGSLRHPAIADVLRDIADDLAAVRGSSTPVDAVATADGSDPATTQALANALKTKVNELITKLNAQGSGVTIKTIKG